MSETDPTPPGHGELTAADLEQLGATPLRKADPASIGPYRLLARLGGGGMGRLYLAREATARGSAYRAQMLVAVKVIRPEYAEDVKFRQRFEREVEAVRRVHHTHTAGLLGSGFDDDERLWMATAYVPGLSLSDAVGHFGPLPPAAVWRLTDEIGQALVAIGAAGIVHRDLKPSNVLLGKDGVRVIDFGVAHTADTSALTVTGQQIGTPAFMSPEQAGGRETGPASDVFSLGSVLALSVTGSGPFGQGATAEVIHRVLYAPPSQEVLTAVAAVDPELAELIGRCLDKDPDRRPDPREVVAAAREHAFAPHWPQPVTDLIRSRADWCGTTTALPPTDQLTILRRAAVKPGTPQPGARSRRPLVLACGLVVAVAAAATAFVLYGPGSARVGPPRDSRPVSLRLPAATATASATARGARPAAREPSRRAPTAPAATVTLAPADALPAAGGPAVTVPASGGQAPVTVTAAPPKPTSTTKSAPWKACTYYSGTALTQYGNTGKRVVEVQCVLHARGYTIGSHGVDGVFGADTRTAVRAFQKSRHLTVDGQVGASTWAALRG